MSEPVHREYHRCLTCGLEGRHPQCGHKTELITTTCLNGGDLYEVGEFERDPKKRRLHRVYQFEKDTFYLSCVACGMLLSARGHAVYGPCCEEGHFRLSPCVVCTECNSHFWVSFKDWKGECIEEAYDYGDDDYDDDDD